MPFSSLSTTLLAALSSSSSISIWDELKPAWIILRLVGLRSGSGLLLARLSSSTPWEPPLSDFPFLCACVNTEVMFSLFIQSLRVLAGIACFMLLLLMLCPAMISRSAACNESSLYCLYRRTGAEETRREDLKGELVGDVRSGLVRDFCCRAASGLRYGFVHNCIACSSCSLRAVGVRLGGGAVTGGPAILTKSRHALLTLLLLILGDHPSLLLFLLRFHHPDCIVHTFDGAIRVLVLHLLARSWTHVHLVYLLLLGTQDLLLLLLLTLLTLQLPLPTFIGGDGD